LKRLIIGTAGHIDHGKTTLVKAITGFDTDRLKEEKQRGISIELGFAPFSLPNGQKAAIVDVPGHERFIKHMLAGAFGIDLVLLTIAADEGVMPQTREHMDIISLLGVNKGIVVITKKDLVDEEWLELVTEEVSEYISTTILNEAPIIAVSAVNHDNISELLNVIQQLSNTIEEKPAYGQARMPIDRVFTMTGFGTVVTGTLWSGQFKVGDNLNLMPLDSQVRVRNLQVHNEKVNNALAGQRVAVNIQGAEVGDIHRGYWLCTPGFLNPSYRLDVKLNLLYSSRRNLKNWSRVRFHLGTDEAFGRVILLDRDELTPGNATYAQLVMEKPVVCYKGDPFVIRFYSPPTTIGGGTIIDPDAAKLKRFKNEVWEQLVIKEQGSLQDLIIQQMKMSRDKIFNYEEITKSTGASEEKVQENMKQLIEEGQVIALKQGEFISSAGMEYIIQTMTTTLKDYHEKFPLRLGYPREDMRSKFFNKINNKDFNYVLKYLEDKALIQVENNVLKLAGHTPLPGTEEKEIIDKIIENMKENPFMPPSLQELKDKFNIEAHNFEAIIQYMVEQGILIKVKQDMYFTSEAVEKGKRILEDYFTREKELSLAAARDVFNSSRKFILPLVEYYDRVRFTRRVGDMRIKV